MTGAPLGGLDDETTTGPGARGDRRVAGLRQRRDRVLGRAAVSGFLSDVIRRNLARDPGDAPAVDLAQDLLDDDFSWVDAAAGPAWAPPEPPLMRTRDLIHPA